MQRITAILFSVLFAAGCAGTAAKTAKPVSAQARKVRVGVYQNKPAVYILPDGSVAGATIAPLLAAAGVNNWTLEFQLCYWAQCLMLLEKGDVDIMVDIAYTPDRAALYDFSAEPVFLTWGQVYAKSSAELNSLAALEGKTVAALANDVHNIGPDGIRKMLERAGVKCDVLDMESYQDVFAAVADGRADAGIVPSLWGGENAARFGLSPSAIRTEAKEIRYAAKKGADPSLLSSLDTAIKNQQKEMVK